MKDENKQAKTIVDKIRMLLMNYELTIAYADGEIKIRESIMSLYKGSKSKSKQKKFINAKVSKERYEIFKEEISKSIQEIKDNLEIILDKYQERYKQVFIAYFLQKKTYNEIASLTGYTCDTINKIIKKLKNDLISFYIP